MRIRSGFMIAVTALVSLSACGGQASTDWPSDLQKATDAFYTAVETDDVEARIALFSDDAIMMPNHWTRTEGREAIAAALRSGEGWVFRLRNRTVVDRHVAGDLAYVANAYEYTWHRDDDPPQWHRTKNVHIWRRDADGAWKLHLDIWNSDAPLNEFDAEGHTDREGQQ